MKREALPLFFRIALVSGIRVNDVGGAFPFRLLIPPSFKFSSDFGFIFCFAAITPISSNNDYN